MKNIFSLCGVILLCVSCNIRPSETGESGEVGRGVFYYKCVNYTFDSACCDKTTTPDFPQALAIGSRFDMEFAMDNSDGYDYLRVIPGSPNHLSESAGVLTLEKGGFVSIFSVSGPNEVVDIVHVLGMPVSDVAIVDDTWDGGDVAFQAIEEITGAVGEEIEIRGVALDKFGRNLAGLLDYTWQIDKPEIASLGENTTDSVLTLYGEAEGSASLLVDVGDFQKEFAIKIKGMNPDTDTDTDTNSDTDTDSSTDGFEVSLEHDLIPGQITLGGEVAQ